MENVETVDRLGMKWPRRSCADLWSPAEKAIHEAMMEVEKAGGSVQLTDAINLLDAAAEAVADHQEGLK